MPEQIKKTAEICEVSPVGGKRGHEYGRFVLNSQRRDNWTVNAFSACYRRYVISSMGVNHGGTGDKSPHNLSGGIVPPDFVMLQNFKHLITCITM